LIVFAVICLWCRLQVGLGSVTLNGAVVVTALSVLYYLRLSVALGMLMALILSVMIWAAVPIAELSWVGWIAISLGLFVMGWVIQFIGHYFEGKKPAFADDLIGLVIGPLFILAEGLFLLGYYTELEQHIVQHAGPVKP
ncbi:DUF962 domain-containing protein, partial [Photobacterium sp. GJ3]|uniref:Mpo1 family 2-hydroxy fatty acid dioxygenase n=1 Tax=Photobacterium sp. GJ3 TaxID=2829502 RepID=UPI001B8AAA07